MLLYHVVVCLLLCLFNHCNAGIERLMTGVGGNVKEGVGRYYYRENTPRGLLWVNVTESGLCNLDIGWLKLVDLDGSDEIWKLNEPVTFPCYEQKNDKDRYRTSAYSPINDAWYTGMMAKEMIDTHSDCKFTSMWPETIEMKIEFPLDARNCELCNTMTSQAHYNQYFILIRGGDHDDEFTWPGGSMEILAHEIDWTSIATQWYHKTHYDPEYEIFWCLGWYDSPRTYMPRDRDIIDWFRCLSGPNNYRMNKFAPYSVETLKWLDDRLGNKTYDKFHEESRIQFNNCSTPKLLDNLVIVSYPFYKLAQNSSISDVYEIIYYAVTRYWTPYTDIPSAVTTFFNAAERLNDPRNTNPRMIDIDLMKTYFEESGIVCEKLQDFDWNCNDPDDYLRKREPAFYDIWYVGVDMTANRTADRDIGRRCDDGLRALIRRWFIGWK